MILVQHSLYKPPGAVWTYINKYNKNGHLSVELAIHGRCYSFVLIWRPWLCDVHVATEESQPHCSCWSTIWWVGLGWSTLWWVTHSFLLSSSLALSYQISAPTIASGIIDSLRYMVVLEHTSYLQGARRLIQKVCCFDWFSPWNKWNNSHPPSQGWLILYWMTRFVLLLHGTSLYL